MSSFIPRTPLQVVLALYLTTFCADAGGAPPLTVDRVVAVVGQHPILLSDLHRRVLLYESNARRAGTRIEPAARRSLVQQLLEAMVDELLILREANDRQIAITDEEIEKAVAAVARSNGLTAEQIYAEAAKAGMNRGDYHEELVRTLREQKLLQLDVVSKLRVEDADIRAAYDRMVAEKRRLRPYHPAWVVVRIPRDASPSVVEARRARADEVVRKARAGTSFVTLALQYSDDSATKAKGGDLGDRVPQGPEQGMTLRPELEEACLRLGVGETSQPIRLDDAFVVLHMLDRPSVRLPSFESSKELLRQEVYTAKVTEARATWLDGLRSKSFVELRFTPIRPEKGQ